MARLDFRLYLVTDRKAAEAAGRGLAAVLDAALSRAARRRTRVGVQLREKDLAGGPLFALAREARAVTREHGARLLVNDRVDVALAAEADGVHLPAGGLPPDAARTLLGPSGLVGLSAHAAAETADARALGADFVVLAPVWDPASKPAYRAPLGLAALAAAARGGGVPVLALGGVTAERVADAVRAGAHGVACIGAVMSAKDPGDAVERLLDALEAAA